LVIASAREYLHAATGMPWEIQGDLAPVFAPFPGISASRVSIPAASPEQVERAKALPPFVHAEAVRLYLGIDSLTSLSLRFSLVEIEEPTITLGYDMWNRPFWLPLPRRGEDASDADSSSMASPSADRSLSAPERESGEDAVAVIARFLRHEQWRFPVRIRGGALRRYTERGRLILSLSNVEADLFPLPEKDTIRISAHVSLPAAGLEADVSLAAGLNREDLLAGGFLSGRLHMTPPGSRGIEGDFSTSFAWQASGRDILLPDVVVAAEGDHLSAQLKLDVREMFCAGKVNLHSLSLPRWFEFGRCLPPGLQQALDKLVGSFDLFLNAHKAEAGNLRGTVASMPIRGYVGAPDFRAPVVVVDLDLDRADIDLLFPFLAVSGRAVPAPVSPRFSHPPLAPFPEAPDAPRPEEQGIEVGYDITIRVAKPRVHDLNGGPLKVLVVPLLEKGEEKTRVSFSGDDILAGRIEGRIDIDERSVRMRYDAERLKLGILPENAESGVFVDGELNGRAIIAVPVSEKGDWADDWKLEVDAGITGGEVRGRYYDKAWSLHAAKARVTGEGNIHAVRADGIRIEGLWALTGRGLRTSWNPKGEDSLSGTFDGGLRWPPLPEAASLSKAQRPAGKTGVERLEGKLSLKGSLPVPAGLWRAQAAGDLTGSLRWLVREDTVALNGAQWKSSGGLITADVFVDYSGKDVETRADVAADIFPGELLRLWNADTPKDFVPPKALRGTASFSVKPGSLNCSKIALDADGASVSGDIVWREASAAGTGKGASSNGADGSWTVRLTADHVNIDALFPPSEGRRKTPPNKTPWNLSFMRGLSLDLRVLLRNAKWQKLNVSETSVTGVLQRNNFSLHGESAGFYKGTAVVLLQGSVVPEKSQVALRKGLLRIQGAFLDRMLIDFANDPHYGGNAEAEADFSGVLRCDADIPAALSGVWSVSIKDGRYPAIVGGGESSSNSFSSAAMSGIMEKGVLRCRDFSLRGTMVDMSGRGWYDMNTRDLDIDVSVTFAKMSTVPVRFYGNASEPRMRVRGVEMILQTVQAVGGTVFDVVWGILALPGRAVSGIISFFSSDDTAGLPEKPRSMPSTAPVRPSPSSGPRAIPKSK
jgi:AsmA protein